MVGAASHDAAALAPAADPRRQEWRGADWPRGPGPGMRARWRAIGCGGTLTGIDPTFLQVHVRYRDGSPAPNLNSGSSTVSGCFSA